MTRIIVIDLIGTLLDLRAMDQHFERFFGEAAYAKSGSRKLFNWQWQPCLQMHMRTTEFRQTQAWR